MADPTRRKTLAERIAVDYIIDPITGCWNWPLTRNKDGYGIVKVYLDGKPSATTANRAAYTVHVGEIPLGMEVRHTCHNPSCCNPHHLILGTHSDNMVDRVNNGTHAGGGCITKEQRAQRLEDMESAMPLDEFARKHGISKMGAWRYYQRNGFPTTQDRC